MTGPYECSVSGQVYDEETGSLRDFRDLDRILLSAKGKDGSVTGYVLAVSGSGEWWLFDEDGRG